MTGRIRSGERKAADKRSRGSRAAGQQQQVRRLSLPDCGSDPAASYSRRGVEATVLRMPIREGRSSPENRSHDNSPQRADQPSPVPESDQRQPLVLPGVLHPMVAAPVSDTLLPRRKRLFRKTVVIAVPKPRTSRLFRARGFGWLVPAAGISLALSACGVSDGLSAPDSAGAERALVAPPVGADPLAPDKAEALTVYWHFRQEQTRAYAQAAIQGTQLTHYTTGAALARAEADVKTLRKAGIVTRGKPISNPRVTAMDMNRRFPMATIQDCLDVSRWVRINGTTGKELLPSQQLFLTRYVTVTTAEKWGDRWMILNVAVRARAC
ncbi:hypothetical protein [Streptomyces sp. 7N604]|uniref:hypothetical protein n=1 Tax=Streptomyces sp. 7N604 TaxID=3457415 RepID=UPI003FCF14CB